MSKPIQDINLLIDAGVFQNIGGKSFGILNVWKRLLEELARDFRFKRVVILDRGNTPRYDVFTYVSFHGERERPADLDAIDIIAMDEQIDLFISSTQTYCSKVFCIQYLHDFIPEKMAFNLNEEVWLDKQRSLFKAKAFICVSRTTRHDLMELYPFVSKRRAAVLNNVISDEYKENDQSEINLVLDKYQVRKPYFVVVGHRMGYKNVIHFVKSFAALANKSELQIVFVGGHHSLEYVLRLYLRDFKNYSVIFPTNRELSCLLGGSLGLVYPSLYEGFGLPILEAMASGCPVVISKQSDACVEVGEDAAIVCDGYKSVELKDVLRQLIESPSYRAQWVEQGLRRAKVHREYCYIDEFYRAINVCLARE